MCEHIVRSVRFVAVSVLAVSLAGCGVEAFDIPRDSGGAPSVLMIVKRVRCELMQLIDDNARTQTELLGNNYHVGLQLNLTVNSSGELAPSFNFPQTSALSLNFGVKLARSHEQNFVLNLYYSLPELRQKLLTSREVARKAGHPNAYEQCPEPPTWNLTGSLGIKESVELAFTSPDRAEKKLDGTGGEFGGYVSFVVTKNINSAGPTWTLTHFKGPGNLGGLSAVNTDKITFGFAPGGPDAKIAAPVASKRVRELLFQLNLNQIQSVR